MKKSINCSVVALLPLACLLSCGKTFLDIKPDAKQVVPATVADYQAILDYQLVMNEAASVGLALIGSDEYYLLDGRLSTLSQPFQRNGYVWAKEVYEGAEVQDWNQAYQRILYANMALGVRNITPEPVERRAWENVVGSALFYRALSFYHLAQLFCKPYDPVSAGTDPGVPLRLDYDVSTPSSRGSLEATYRQIISDLETAVDLLPNTTVNKHRPSKAAACALLGRAFLQMGSYGDAEHYAAMGLESWSGLIDFNGVDTASRYPFPADYGLDNPEVMFYSRPTSLTLLATARFNADSVLLKSYLPGDLRRGTYFYDNDDGRVLFKGSYVGSAGYFTGLASSELWLMRAECRARSGNVSAAMDDLNELLAHRYDRNQFVPVTASNAGEALDIILLERRKELFMRGTRWEDLRRLNKEPRLAKTVVRVIDGQRYELPPNDPRWVWPIPDNEVDLSGLIQNAR